jgi:hypothetical protein
MTSPYRVLQVAHKILTEETWCRYEDEDCGNCGTARTAEGRKTSPRNATAVQFTLIGAIARAVNDLCDSDYLIGHGWNVYVAALKLVQPKHLNDLQFALYCDEIGYKGCKELLEKHL